MTALLVCFAIMGVCVVVILTATPELLAATAVAGIILGAQYALPFSDWNRTMSQTEALIIEQRDGKPYVTNAPLPERIEISRELWNGTEDYDPQVDGDTGIKPPAMWRETIQHADPDRDNDGYVFHVDAENVVCSYRVAGVPESGNITGTLASWGEK